MTDMQQNVAPVSTDNVSSTTESTTINDWRSSLPEEIREAPSFTKFKDVGDLANSYLAAEKFVSAEKIAVPRNDSDWDGVFDKLGRPKEAGEYKWETPEELKTYIPDDRIESFKQLAHKAGLLPRQVDALREWYIGNITNDLQNMQAINETNREESLSALRREWGGAFEKKSNAANQIISNYFSDALLDKINNSGIGHDPEFAKAMAAIADAYLPENAILGTKDSTDVMTPDSAQEAIRREQSHPAYLDASHPQHAYQVKKVNALFNQAYRD